MRWVLLLVLPTACAATPEPEEPDQPAPVSCPAGSKADGDACVATEVACPAGAHWDGRACRADVRCPGRAKWDGLGCAGPVECPEGSVPSGDGCAASVICPAGTVFDGARCVPGNVAQPGMLPPPPLPPVGNSCGCMVQDLMCMMRCSQRQRR